MIFLTVFSLSSNGGVMPKCSNVIFKIQTAARKTINNKIRCHMESFSAFLISQILSGSASIEDVFYHHLWRKIIGSCGKNNNEKQMTATGDKSKVTAILLIQPVSHFQYGRAAHPANLSFRFVWSASDPSTRPLYYLMHFQFWAEAHRLSNICT